LYKGIQSVEIRNIDFTIQVNFMLLYFLFIVQNFELNAFDTFSLSFALCPI